jgi:UDP-N-acetyl-D-glucosamine dehydrogenase
VIRLLEERGAEVTYHDPHVAKYTEDGHARTSVALTDDVLSGSDAVVIVTDHSSVDYTRLVAKASLVIDTRNALAKTANSRARIVSLTPTAPRA